MESKELKNFGINLWRLMCIMLYVIGVIGGTGNLIFYHEYVCAVGVLICGVCGFGKAKKLFNAIINHKE